MLSAAIYGKMSVQHLDGLRSDAPAGWIDKSTWAEWLDDVKSALDIHIWPLKSGLSSTAKYPSKRIEALTRGDFDVMKVMQFGGKTGSSLASAALGATKIASSEATIWQCFDRENLWGSLCAWIENKHVATKPVGLLASYQHAFPNGVFGSDAIDVDISAKEQQFMGDPVARCLGSVTEILKLEFQRPRPFQLAEELDFADFFHWVSSSANSPALPAGHELQAIFVFLCSVRHFGLTGKANIVREFAGWCAGIGDRRVYAGLHYPSDILSSQYIAATLIDKVFPQDETEHLRDMFRLYLRHSTTLHQIREYQSKKNTASPFGGALTLLDESISPKA